MLIIRIYIPASPSGNLNMTRGAGEEEKDETKDDSQEKLDVPMETKDDGQKKLEFPIDKDGKDCICKNLV